MRKYRIVLEVQIYKKNKWVSVSDFTETEVEAFNNANKGLIQVSVLETSG